VAADPDEGRSNTQPPRHPTSKYCDHRENRFPNVIRIGRRFGDPDLTALGLLGLGQSLVLIGEGEQGLRCLDEVMVSVLTGELNPIVTGVVYCAAVESGQLAYDAQRTADWTRALAQW
jgi:hypothetical protein